MPPHVIDNMAPKRANRKCKYWHPWLVELRRRKRANIITQMKYMEENLPIHDVVPSDDDELL